MNKKIMFVLISLAIGGCATQRQMVLGVGANASKEEIQCHDMAQDGRFLGVLVKTGAGAGLGAIAGYFTDKTGGGTGLGTAIGFGAGLWTEGDIYKKAYNACLANYSTWEKERKTYKQQNKNHGKYLQ